MRLTSTDPTITPSPPPSTSAGVAAKVAIATMTSALIAATGVGCASQNLASQPPAAGPPAAVEAAPRRPARSPAADLRPPPESCEGRLPGKLAAIEELVTHMREWARDGRKVTATPGTYDPKTGLPLGREVAGPDGHGGSHAFEPGEMWMSSTDGAESTKVHALSVDEHTLDIEVSYPGGAILRARQVVRGDEIVDSGRLRVGATPLVLQWKGMKTVYSANSEWSLCGRCNADESAIACETASLQSANGKVSYFALGAVHVVGREPEGTELDRITTGSISVGSIPEFTVFEMLSKKVVRIGVKLTDGATVKPVTLEQAGSEVAAVGGRFYVLLDGQLLEPTSAGWRPVRDNRVERNDGTTVFVVEIGSDHKLRVRSSPAPGSAHP